MLVNKDIKLVKDVERTRTMEMKLIKKNELAELLRDSWKLRCLEAAGVDNWTWYGQAMNNYDADEYTNDELTEDYDEAN